jgi:hypothetical protein
MMHRLIRRIRKLALLGKPGLIRHTVDCPVTTGWHNWRDCRCTAWVAWPEFDYRAFEEFREGREL